MVWKRGEGELRILVLLIQVHFGRLLTHHIPVQIVTYQGHQNGSASSLSR